MKAFRRLNRMRVVLAFWRDEQPGIRYGLGCAFLSGLFVLFLVAIPLSVFGDYMGPPDRAVQVYRAMEARAETFFVCLCLTLAATVWWLIGARPYR